MLWFFIKITKDFFIILRNAHSFKAKTSETPCQKPITGYEYTDVAALVYDMCTRRRGQGAHAEMALHSANNKRPATVGEFLEPDELVVEHSDDVWKRFHLKWHQSHHRFHFCCSNGSFCSCCCRCNRMLLVWAGLQSSTLLTATAFLRIFTLLPLMAWKSMASAATKSDKCGLQWIFNYWLDLGSGWGLLKGLK